MRRSPRTRRLLADFEAVAQLQRESTVFSFEAQGDHPEHYRMRFNGYGFWKMDDERIVVRDYHEVVIELGSAYPRMIPNLIWQTPIFHPNISSGGVVCLGGYGTSWVPSLTLDEMCIMLWDMIRYRNFDVDSPYNREAALWAKTQQQYEFPIDYRPLRDQVSGNSEVSPIAEVRNVVPPPVVQNPAGNRTEIDDDDVVVIDAEIVRPGPQEQFNPAAESGSEADITFLD